MAATSEVTAPQPTQEGSRPRSLFDPFFIIVLTDLWVGAGPFFRGMGDFTDFSTFGTFTFFKNNIPLIPALPRFHGGVRIHALARIPVHAF